MRDQVLHYIRERDLLHAGERVAVAVSGGADSVALLRVLLELRAELGIVIFVAHFNHQLRGAESDADERFVADLARHLDLRFFAGRGDVLHHAEINQRSLEHAARELRYQWLIELARREKLDAIATAHTSDDQAETVLMKFLRGAGTRGLAGIHPVLVRDGFRILRPLLTTARAEIEHFLSSLNQPWREDHTNLDTQHTRNRVRHELLPLLERDFNPNLRWLLGEAADVARVEEDFWQATVGLERIERRTHVGVLQLNRFDQLHVALQRRLLKQFLAKEGFPAEFHHIEILRRCALGETARVGLAGGWQGIRTADGLALTKPLASQRLTNYEYTLSVPGKVHIAEIGATISATFRDTDFARQAEPGTLLRADAVGPELAIRNWRPGDRFRPAYTASEVKLKRLFADLKIPPEKRRMWPVALRGKEIVWVYRMPVSSGYQWQQECVNSENTNALPVHVAVAEDDSVSQQLT